MTVLSISSLSKSYQKGSFKLDIDSFSLEEGSILGLLGINGAGKTTLLKLLLNIIFPDTGTITWTKNPGAAPDFITANTSYMPEYKNLYQNMSVGKILNFSSHAIPAWNSSKAEELLSIFPLNQGKKISALSYGEKTRLYAVITFSKDVPYIILDEPSRGLDPVMQERLLEQVKLSSQQGKTIIFSSHQLPEVEETADVTAIIKDGKIILNEYLDDLKSSLFILAAPAEFAASEYNGLHILARRKQVEHDIFLCRGTETVRNSIKEPHNVFGVNLKDIFLTINEGEVYK